MQYHNMPNHKIPMKNRLIYILITLLLPLAETAYCQNQPAFNLSGTKALSSPGLYVVPLSESYPLDINSSVPSAFNFTRIYYPQTPMKTVPDFDGSKNQPIIVNTTYKDGFGEPLMNIQRNNSTTDIVTPYEPRQRKKLLEYCAFPVPYHSKFMKNVFAQQQSYYNGRFVDGKLAPFALKKASTPFRVPTVEKFHPGETNTNGKISSTEGFNVNGEVLILTLSGSSVCTSGYYYPNELQVKKEQQASSISMAYYDKNDRLICKRLSTSSGGIGGYLITYYIYDDLGRLTVTIPPKVSSALHTSGCVTNIQGKTFTYAYDDKGRVIEKGIPDQDGKTQIVYDLKDRAVMTQSPNQAGSYEYSFNIYDNIGRVIMTGLYTQGEDRTYWQGVIDGTTVPTNRGVPANETLEYWIKNGYVSGAYPANLHNCEIVAINYYDSYTTFPANLRTFSPAHSSHYFTGAPYVTPVWQKLGHGRLVATREFIQTNGHANNFTNTEVTSIFFYDEQGRVIQTQTLNPWNNWDIVSNQYNFVGQKVLEVSEHNAWASAKKPSTTVKTLFSYNSSSGRLYAIHQSYDGAPAVQIANFEFDDLGRRKQKQQGNVEIAAYTYNIRGQLAGINEDVLTLTAPIGMSFDNRSYMSKLCYEKGFNVPRNDGKLSGYYWRTKGSDVGAYGYRYDDAGRMTYADYYGASSGGTWSKSIQDYTVSNLTYDDNGNIESMNQRGPTTSGPGNIDILDYDYDASNRLKKVTDNGVTSPTVHDFENGASAGNDDYTYDANGNMTSDLNKGITGIIYDYRNKPLEIIGTGTTKNTYSAGGTLLLQEITNSGNTTNYYYWGPFVYKDDDLQYVLTAEGRARYNATDNAFEQDFFVRDHQNNVRAVVQEKHEYVTYEDFSVTFEAVAATVEEATWSHVGAVRDISPTLSPADAMVGRLNGCDNTRQIGASLLVHAMAGDQLNLQGYTFYEDPNPTNYNTYALPENMMSSLLSALTGGAVPAGEGGLTPTQTINSLVTSTNYAAYENIKQAATSSALPRAYLNYLVFDEHFTLKPEYSQVVQVSSSPGTWGLLTNNGPMEIPITGYVMVYFSNESCMDVAINNITVTKYFGELLEEQHYYPHGLVIEAGGQTTTPLVNKYLFEGNKMQSENGLELYDFHARQYDPQLGRFWSADPAADAMGQEIFNPYHFCNNDPANLVDPLGLWGINDNNWLPVVWCVAERDHSRSTGGGGAADDPSGSLGRGSGGGSGARFCKFGDPGTNGGMGSPNIGDMMRFFFGARGRSAAEIAAERRMNEEMRQAELNSLDYTGIFSDWDGAFWRGMVPDFASIGIGYMDIMGEGFGQSLELQWVLHGPEASGWPVLTTTTSVGAGYEVDAAISIGASRYTGDASRITRSMLETNSANGDVPGTWGSAAVSAGIFGGIQGNLGRQAAAGGWIYGGAVNIGLGLPLGDVPFNAATGVNNTFILKDFR